MILRPAVFADWARLFFWRNDPEVCKQFKTGEVELGDHLDWFRRALASPDHKIFIAESEQGTPIGVVRFAKEGDHWEVSVAVDPRFRQSGLGLGMIEDARTLMCRESLRAEIRIQNAASVRAFVHAGFQYVAHNQDYITLECRP